jgi:uncharacterized membrane protein YtjA (UPF0391 family)
MENQQLVNYNRTDALNHFKVMNKLGATFFILFLIGAFLPLANLDGWSTETINLNTLASPTFLIILALIGAAVNLTGISRIAARAASLLFVTLIVGWCIAQLYDIYDLAKTAREIRGRDFEFKHFARSFKDMFEVLPIRARDLVSPASFLLSLSFVGITACIFSPRYKENKQFKAALLGQAIEENKSTFTVEKSTTTTSKKSPFVDTFKNMLSLVIIKAVGFIKYAYQIIKPLIDALLDKAADIICKQQPNLKREQVKIVLLGVLVVLIYCIIF